MSISKKRLLFSLERADLMGIQIGYLYYRRLNLVLQITVFIELRSSYLKD